MNPTRTKARTTQSLSVLLIDDDEFMLSFVKDMLRDLGLVDVRTAKDGAQGSAIFDQAAIKPDVVVCDLKMPGTDGFQFMEMMAERNYGGGIILISGMDARTLNSASLMAKFHQLNFVATIAKPVDERSLAEALSKVI